MLGLLLSCLVDCLPAALARVLPAWTLASAPLSPFDRLPDEILERIIDELVSGAGDNAQNRLLAVGAFGSCSRRLHRLAMSACWEFIEANTCIHHATIALLRHYGSLVRRISLRLFWPKDVAAIRKVLALVTTRCTSISIVYSGDNRRATDARKLFRQIRPLEQTLRRLAVHFQGERDHPPQTPLLIACLSQTLPRCPQLDSLHIAAEGLVAMDSYEPLTEALASCRTLRSLSLSIRDVGILTDLLPANLDQAYPLLTCLKLGTIRISLGAIAKLLEELAETNLESFTLRANVVASDQPVPRTRLHRLNHVNFGQTALASREILQEAKSATSLSPPQAFAQLFDPATPITRLQLGSYNSTWEDQLETVTTFYAEQPVKTLKDVLVVQEPERVPIFRQVFDSPPEEVLATSFKGLVDGFRDWSLQTGVQVEAERSQPPKVVA